MGSIVIHNCQRFNNKASKTERSETIQRMEDKEEENMFQNW